jgi:hypothetical protein
VLAGDIDDIHEHLDEEERARGKQRMPDSET